MSRRRVFGPYKHGNKWRIVLRGEDGTAVVQAFGSEDEAKAERKRIEGTLADREGLTVSKAIEEHELYLRLTNKPASVSATVYLLNGFFGDYLNRRLNQVTVDVCKKAYETLTAKWAVDTHRNALTKARAMLKWAVEKGHIKRNPALEIKPIGKTKKGKPQLRIDEARKWLAIGLEMAKSSQHAAAAVTTLLLGTRATETAVRKVRDLDDGGRLLWIEDTKSDAGRRTLEVPEVMQPILLALAEGKDGSDKLFHYVSRQSIYHMVHEICDAAKVPRVSPHGMRGLNATLAFQASAMPHMVAASLGHSSFNMTEAHYVDRDAAGKARQRASLKVLQGGR